MAEYKDSTTVLIADVDCTASGKDLCNEIGVRGYPTIKSGDPSDLQDYKGGRSFDDLQKQYTEASEKKEKDAEAIKNSGLGLLKAVHAHEKKEKKASEKKEKDAEAIKNS